LNHYKSHTTTENEIKAPVNKGADEVLQKASDFTFFLSRESIGQSIPAIITGVVVAIFYISLSHYHVKSLKKKEDLKKELNELRSEYISVKSSLMKRSNQSEIAKELLPEGIEELRTPPNIIESDKK
jgi:predicted membrane protein